MIDVSKLSPSDLIAYDGVIVTLGLGTASVGGTVVAIVISAAGNRREARRDQ